ncbi:MAG: rhodanese-like domain-containing protein [Desulfuromonadales bacterium]
MTETTVKRITPDEARRRMDSGKAILVCAYESDEKFRPMHLEGAESLHQFRERLPSIPKEQEIIFYCA